MKKRILIMVAIISSVLGIFALAKTQPKTEPPKALRNIEKEEMTRDEMFADLKESIEEDDEIFDMVPELKAEKDKDGKFYYTFKGIRLEKLSKEDLDKLLARVNQVLVKLRTDRIQNQLETVKRVQNIQRMSASPQVQQPPRTPSQGPSAPRTPSAPPASPSRR